MKKTLLSIIVVILFVQPTYPQCGCMSSMASGLLSPSTIGQAGTLREGFALFSLSTHYSTGDIEYSSNRIVPNVTVREFWNSSLFLKGSYGITKRLTTYIGANYILQNNIKTYIFNYKSSGWNNIQLGVKYNLLFNPKENYEITAIADVSLPLKSVTDTTYMYLQPTSGALASSIGLFYHKGFSESEIDFFSSYSSTIWSKNSVNYRFGTIHSLTLAITKPIIKQLSAGLIGNFTYKDKDKLKEVTQANSGFKVFTISPNFFLFFDNFSITLNTEVPIYNEYFGSQIGKVFSAALNLQYKIDMN